MPTGTLRISSTPAGAEISVDGEDRGRTPATLAGLPAGAHVVSLLLEGYAEERLGITLEPSSTASIAVNLTPTTPSPMGTGSPLFLIVVAGIFLGVTALVIAGIYFFRKR